VSDEAIPIPQGDCFGTPALAGGARENTLAMTDVRYRTKNKKIRANPSNPRNPCTEYYPLTISNTSSNLGIQFSVFVKFTQ